MTQNIYKKGRTFCKVCFNIHVFVYYKNKFCSKSSLKTDVGTQTDFSDKQESLFEQEGSNKKVRSSKQDGSNKQVRSNKKDTSGKQVSSSKHDTSINIKNVDPECLMEKV